MLQVIIMFRESTLRGEIISRFRQSIWFVYSQIDEIKDLENLESSARMVQLNDFLGFQLIKAICRIKTKGTYRAVATNPHRKSRSLEETD